MVGQRQRGAGGGRSSVRDLLVVGCLCLAAGVAGCGSDTPATEGAAAGKPPLEDLQSDPMLDGVFTNDVRTAYLQATPGSGDEWMREQVWSMALTVSACRADFRVFAEWKESGGAPEAPESIEALTGYSTEMVSTMGDAPPSPGWQLESSVDSLTQLVDAGDFEALEEGVWECGLVSVDPEGEFRSITNEMIDRGWPPPEGWEPSVVGPPGQQEGAG